MAEPTMAFTVIIEQARLSAEIEELARISDTLYPSVTRVLFTAPDLKVRALLKRRYAEAGLVVREDAIGNTFARWVGTDAGAAPVGTGSHTDAIPNAGRFDGVVGVLGGLEAIRALQRAGFRPRRSIELVMSTAEEPTRFGPGCVGSRIMAGALAPAQIAALRDAEGRSLDEVRTAAGCHGSVASVRLPENYFSAFVELHIEQGYRLEQAGLPIGIVTAIAAPATLRVQLSGDGGHAGAVLMPDRHDPVLAASDLMLAVDRIARATGDVNSVATCGLVQVLPGAVNSIPREVHLTIDVRDIDLARRDAMLAAIRAAARSAAEKFGVRLSDEVLNADAPATCAPEILAALKASCAELGLRSQEMTSRAYHDSLFMALVCPTGMIFVPSKGGFSHRPDEFTKPEEIAEGVRVLASTLARLSA
jgi:N-carbamoyl-L-amino-acid hydrolase